MVLEALKSELWQLLLAYGAPLFIAGISAASAWAAAIMLKHLKGMELAQESKLFGALVDEFDLKTMPTVALHFENFTKDVLVAAADGDITAEEKARLLAKIGQEAWAAGEEIRESMYARFKPLWKGAKAEWESWAKARTEQLYLELRDDWKRRVLPFLQNKNS